MARRVEGECAHDVGRRRYFRKLRHVDRSVRARLHCEHRNVPAVLGQVAAEAERALDAAAAFERRKMERHE
jgi:hypothetical protein